MYRQNCGTYLCVHCLCDTSQVSSAGIMWWKFLFVVFGAIVVQHVAKIIILLNLFGHVHRHQPGPCELVPDMDYGSEDMEATPDGKVFITSGIGKIGDPTKFVGADNRGRIMLLELNSPDRNPQSLPITGDFNRSDFHPHGISLWQDQRTGATYVYVVNHPIGGDRIEKFRFDETTRSLQYLRSFQKDKAIRMMNDLHVVGEDQFYCTNFHYYNSVLGMNAETYLLLRYGSVVYYDGQRHHVTLTGLMGPNGINMSPDGKYLYVATPLDQVVRVYTRNSDNTLTFQNLIHVHTLPDNINVDPSSGDLYLGCHPVPWKLARHFERPNKYNAPSQVLRVKVEGGKAVDITEVYAEEGDVISGSTVAIYYGNQLLVGTVAHKMLRCNVTYMPE